MIKDFLKALLLREKASSEKYVRYLRKIGVEVGSDVSFYSPTKTLVDITCPWLLSIGNHVRITEGVKILTHDYSWSVLKQLPENAGIILGAQSPVKIGNNVFVGMNAIITRGVTIGDNVVIGAGSVVTKNCESNSVYVGNPARKIMSIEEYYSKRQSMQFEEAKTMAKIYVSRFGKNPPKEVFREYFMLFLTPEEAESIPDFKAQMSTGEGFSESYNYMRDNKPMFGSYELFLHACLETKE